MAPSVADKYRIVFLASEGCSLGQIAERLHLPKSTVKYIVNKWKRTDLVERRRPGAGRHRISILDEDVALIEVVRNDPLATAVRARNLTGFPGCLKTALRRIKSSGLRNHVTANKPGIIQQHKEARISFALEYLLKDEAFWSRVVFSDEKVFQFSRNGRIRMYRPRNSRFSERYVHNTHNSGRFSVLYLVMDFCR
jgi:DNA-binding MarR family transcriptional regulator